MSKQTAEIAEGQRVSISRGRGNPRGWGHFTGFYDGDKMQVQFDDGHVTMVNDSIIRGERGSTLKNTIHSH